MPTDQPGPLIAEAAPPRESAIENELPSYRAISNRAIFSVICGVLASFSYASLTFLIFAVLAVLFGVLADKAIQRTPDLLTGTRLANLGIAMGLVFGLTVVTYTGIQSFILNREATKFAREYARILKEGSLGEVLLYREPPDARKEHTAADKQKEFESMKPRERMMLEQRVTSLLNLHKGLSAKDARIRFVDVETQGLDESISSGIFYFAAVLYELEGVAPSPGTKETPHHALAILKGRHKGRRYEWWVEDTRFPYVPKSYKMDSKPVDDGHGHAR